MSLRPRDEAFEFLPPEASQHFCLAQLTIWRDETASITSTDTLCPENSPDLSRAEKRQFFEPGHHVSPDSSRPARNTFGKPEGALLRSRHAGDHRYRKEFKRWRNGDDSRRLAGNANIIVRFSRTPIFPRFTQGPRCPEHRGLKSQLLDPHARNAPPFAWHVPRHVLLLA